MAIYSGFATRKQEERYDGLVKKLLETLSQIVITYVESIKIQPFQSQFHRIYNNLVKMDLLKFSLPKISGCLHPLAQHFGMWTSEKEASELGSELGQSEVKQVKKRPMTSNYVKEKIKPYDLDRKTINFTPNTFTDNQNLDYSQVNHNLPNRRYAKHLKDKQSRQIRSQSFSIKRPKNRDHELNLDKLELTTFGQNATMEELMEKNRLIQRKMSLFRKKKYIQQSKMPARIQEMEEQDEPSIL